MPSQCERSNEAHEHRWRVLSFEHTTMQIGYRCADCGAERFTRPEDQTEART